MLAAMSAGWVMTGLAESTPECLAWKAHWGAGGLIPLSSLISCCTPQNWLTKSYPRLSARVPALCCPCGAERLRRFMSALAEVLRPNQAALNAFLSSTDA
jgi:hypothetical protein